MKIAVFLTFQPLRGSSLAAKTQDLGVLGVIKMLAFSAKPDHGVIPELALPKKQLQFFGCKASSGIQFFFCWIPTFVGMTRTGFPMKHRCQILKKNLDDANSGMTVGGGC